jgi:hypothetical protein
MRIAARSHLHAVCVFLGLFLALPVSGVGQTRIVAVGDVHGAYEDFVGILQKTGVIDSNRQWIGGSGVLVQTGDLVDRGPDSRKCLDLVMELERQAAQQQGRVIVLLGNHEVMTIMGDLRYVDPDDYRAFADEHSEQVRAQAFAAYKKFISGHGNQRSGANREEGAARQKFMADYPLGYFERRDAFGPKGVYGRWLRQRDAVVRVGDVLFVHGGLNPALQFRQIKELNDHVHSDLANFDSLWQLLVDRDIIWRYMKLDEATRQVQEAWRAIQLRGQVEDPLAAQGMRRLLGIQGWMVFLPDSPIWYRGLALQPEEDLKGSLGAMLARLKAGYIVAGHTVRPKYDIGVRFDKRVFLIDTGMLKKQYGGRASALEIQNGRFTAYYADQGPEVLRAPEGGEATPAHSPGEGAEKQEP